MIIDVREPEGNAFVIIGYVRQLLKASGREKEIEAVTKDMESGNYRHLLSVAEKTTFGSITFEGLEEENPRSGGGK